MGLSENVGLIGTMIITIGIIGIMIIGIMIIGLSENVGLIFPMK